MKGRGEDTMLAFLRRELEAAARNAIVQLQLHPQRADRLNKSPDFNVEVTVDLFLFDRQVRMKVPLLIEVEASGFHGGLADLERYVERSNDGSGRQSAEIELPFVIATEAGGSGKRELVKQLPVRFVAVEVEVPEAEGD